MKKRSAKTVTKSIEKPIPYVPAELRTTVDSKTAKVRTLADIGLSPARAWALMWAQRCHAGEFTPAAKVCVLHEEFNFRVVMVLEDEAEYSYGNVYAFEHVAKTNERGHLVCVTVPRCIGNVSDGVLTDTLQLSERDYLENVAKVAS